MLSSLYTMLKLSKMTSPNKLFDYDCVTLCTLYCRELGPAEYVKNVMTVIPGPSKRPSLPL